MTSSKFTNGEIRAAMLKTAETFERNPELFEFWNVNVPDCGTPGCIIGWIGHHLGIAPKACISDIAERAPTLEQTFFYERWDDMRTGVCLSSVTGEQIPAVLRTYADRYFPLVPA